MMNHPAGLHGPGKRWDSTRYTCTTCRNFEAFLVALAGVRMSLAQFAEGVRRATQQFAAFGAADPPRRRYRRIR